MEGSNSHLFFLLAFMVLGGILFIVSYTVVKEERRADKEAEHEEDEASNVDNQDNK